MMETVKRIRITESELDELGHVGYLQYILFLQDARREWYERAGFPLAKKREEGVAVTMKKLEIVDLKEAALGETLSVATSPARLGTTSFTLKQVIRNRREEPVAEAAATMVCFNLAGRTSMIVPEELRRHFRAGT